MSGPCKICGSPLDGDTALLPACANLLRWVRGYFAHVPGLELHIRPQTTFKDLGADSLDWMNWLVEAEDKLGIAIPDPDAEKLITVGEFLRYLRAQGASWACDDHIRLEDKSQLLSHLRLGEGASRSSVITSLTVRLE